MNIDDHSDTSHATATLDNLSGDINAPYELTGLGNGAIKWGAGVTAVNVTGGTNGGSGVTFAVNSTQSTTTTTINGGINQNVFNLSNARALELRSACRVSTARSTSATCSDSLP